MRKFKLTTYDSDSRIIEAAYCDPHGRVIIFYGPVGENSDGTSKIVLMVPVNIVVSIEEVD